VVAQRWQRGVLRRAAQRYADRGWRVVPGAFLIGDRYVCGPLCPTVACHPAVDHWEHAASSDISDVDTWWEATPFSVLLATGGAFDVIETPAHLGAPAAREVTGPVAVTPAPGRPWAEPAPGTGRPPRRRDARTGLLDSGPTDPYAAWTGPVGDCPGRRRLAPP
jgi:hypothetical protein